MMKIWITFILAAALTGGAAAQKNKNLQGPAKPEHIANVKKALPEKAPAKPKKARKILVVTRCEGFVHGSIAIGVEAIRLMGEQTGAYTIEETRELDLFNDTDLEKFDAVLFLSTTRLKPTPEQQQALLKFVRDGKGMIGIHAATDNFYGWSEGAKMMGGLFCGHPWTASCTVQMKLNEPDHPVNACFHGESFKVKDEIYQFKEPYSRDNQRVIVSLDMEDPDTKAVKGGKPDKVTRTDGDFGVTWVRQEGKGRVFYCSMGHNHHIFWDNRILQHYLAGIQYALGDYDVPDEIK
ncbi:ThuA domain-containing protein [Pontiella agarivorans]|nr:ThuA domain-containing protein [Pontiella agarivorans]